MKVSTVTAAVMLAAAASATAVAGGFGSYGQDGGYFCLVPEELGAEI